MGKHLIIDLYECKNSDMVTDKQCIKTAIHTAVEISKLNLVKVDCTKLEQDTDPEKYGWTVFAVLKESHMTFHTWSELNLVQVDLFSCKDFDEQEVMKFLNGICKPKYYAHKIVDRPLEFSKGWFW